jgi:hypothetical protein
MSAQETIEKKQLEDRVTNQLSGKTPGAPADYVYKDGIIREDDDETTPDQAPASNQDAEQDNIDEENPEEENSGEEGEGDESQVQEVEIGLSTDEPATGKAKRKSKLKIKNEIIARMDKNRTVDKGKIAELEERLKFQETVNHLDSTNQVEGKEPDLVVPDPIDYDGFEDGADYKKALGDYDKAVKDKQNKELDSRVEARMAEVEKKRDVESDFAAKEEAHFEKAQQFSDTYKIKDYADSEAHFIQKYSKEARDFLVSNCSNSHLIIKRAHKNPDEIDKIIALAKKKTERSANEALMLLGELNSSVVVRQLNHEQTDALDGDIGGGIIKSSGKSADDEVETAPGAYMYNK